MVSELPRLKDCGSCQRSCDSQSGPKHDVFKYSYTQNETCKAGVENLKVSEDFGDYRNRSDSYSDSQNDNQGKLVPLWPCNGGISQPWPECQSDYKRNPSANECQPTYLSSLFTGEQLLGFSTRQKHQKQQPHPVYKIENGCVLTGQFKG